jgi:1-pyrroline-5-carboxylate dehydrogenase
VSSSVWRSGFKDQLLEEVAKIKIGPPQQFGNFMGPVIGRSAFDTIMGYVRKAKESGDEILFGGTGTFRFSRHANFA